MIQRRETVKPVGSYVEVERIGELVDCHWCGKMIGLAHHVQQRVCMRCFKQKRAEGVPDPVIFGYVHQNTDSQIA